MRSNFSDHHHFFYPRSAWNYGPAKKLRNDSYMIVELPRDPVHEAIHSLVPYVPVPDSSVASQVLDKIEFLREKRVVTDNDPPNKRLAVLIGLFSEVDGDVSYALEAQLRIICKFENLH